MVLFEEKPSGGQGTELARLRQGLALQHLGGKAGGRVCWTTPSTPITEPPSAPSTSPSASPLPQSFMERT